MKTEANRTPNAYVKAKNYRAFIRGRVQDGFSNDALGQWQRGNPAEKSGKGMSMAGATLGRHRKSTKCNGKRGKVSWTLGRGARR